MHTAYEMSICVLPLQKIKTVGFHLSFNVECVNHTRGSVHLKSSSLVARHFRNKNSFLIFITFICRKLKTGILLFLFPSIN